MFENPESHVTFKFLILIVYLIYNYIYGATARARRLTRIILKQLMYIVYFELRQLFPTLFMTIQVN